MRNTAGSRTSALPMATRWRWPPESWEGLRRATSVSPSTSAASRAFRSRSCFETPRTLKEKAMFWSTFRCG